MVASKAARIRCKCHNSDPIALCRCVPVHRRRAWELLPNSRDGMTEAMRLAQGFTVQHMVDLVRTGLATATAKRIRAGHREIEVARMRDHARAAATDQRGTGSSLIATSARRRSIHLLKALGFDLGSIHAAEHGAADAIRTDLDGRPPDWLQTSAKSRRRSRKDFEGWTS
jgi:hypothetical protein